MTLSILNVAPFLFSLRIKYYSTSESVTISSIVVFEGIFLARESRERNRYDTVTLLMEIQKRLLRKSEKEWHMGAAMTAYMTVNHMLSHVDCREECKGQPFYRVTISMVRLPLY